jgi:hypothetical protein
MRTDPILSSPGSTFHQLPTMEEEERKYHEGFMREAIKMVSFKTTNYHCLNQ